MKRLGHGVLFVLVIIGLFCLAAYSLGTVGGRIRTSAKSERYEGGGFAFTGSLSEGKFDGYGEARYDDGSIFQGEFKDGRVSGEGAYFSAEGWRFEGVFEGGGILSADFRLEDGEGIGVRRIGGGFSVEARGFKYEGGLSARGQNGEGAFTFPDGTVYEGGFFKGLAEGRGKLTASDGSVICEGEFSAGKYIGGTGE